MNDLRPVNSLNVIKTIIVLASLFIAPNVTGQSLECPIANGVFKNFDLMYSHHDPDYGAVVLSSVSDTINAVIDGKVLRVFKHAENDVSVILKVDSIAMVYRSMRSVSVEDGAHIKSGEVVGFANKSHTGQYNLWFSYFVKAESINPKRLFKCRHQ